MADILWADPQVSNGRGPSKRGIGHSFGPDVTNAFLSDNNLGTLLASFLIRVINPIQIWL